MTAMLDYLAPLWIRALAELFLGGESRGSVTRIHHSPLSAKSGR
jgi:hypothetical protein